MERHEAIRAMIDSGATVHQTAKHFNLSPATIRLHAGLSITSDMKLEIVRLRDEEGLSFYEIRDRMGFAGSVQQIRGGYQYATRNNGEGNVVKSESSKFNPKICPLDNRPLKRRRFERLRMERRWCGCGRYTAQVSAS